MSNQPRTLAGARVLVGVGGGIAAYKTAHLVRGLVGEGAEVRVVPTPASLEFVGAATWEALSHHRVLTSVFEDVDEVAHVRHGQEADLVVVAPATADLLARLRIGRADDMLTASALSPAPRSSSPPRCTPRCGSTPRPARTSPCCVSAARPCSTPPSAA